MKNVLRKVLVVILLVILIFNNSIKAITFGQTVYIDDYWSNGREIATFNSQSGGRQGLLKYNRPNRSNEWMAICISIFLY